MLMHMPGQRQTVFCRGLSLFGALLALALLGMIVLAASTFFETLAAERRARIAVQQLTVLADASASHVHGRFPELMAAARGGPVEITLAQLKGAGSLPADFSAVDALGRGYRVLILAAGADAIDVLAAEAVGAGDTVPPSAALLEAAGEARLGLVAPDAPSRLAGPTLDHDVSAFQAAFGGAPAVGALAALRRFDHQAVYGGRLQRIAVPGFPEANRMETDLDMGGNAITGAGRLSGASLALSGDLEAGGDIAVTGDLTVGQAVRVAGTVEAAWRDQCRYGFLRGRGFERVAEGERRAPGRKYLIGRRRHGRIGRGDRDGHRRQRQSRAAYRQHGVGPHGDRRHAVRRFGQGRGHPRERASRRIHGRVQHPHRRPMHGVRPMKPLFALTLLIGAFLLLAGFFNRLPPRNRRPEMQMPQPRSPLFEALEIRASEDAARQIAGTGEDARSDGMAWDRERAFAGMERLRAEIVMLGGLRGAQRELLQWNRERIKTGRAPALLPAAPLPGGGARRLVPVAAGDLRCGSAGPPPVRPPCLPPPAVSAAPAAENTPPNESGNGPITKDELQ